MGKLKRSVCVAEGDCLLFRATRGDCIVENDCAAPARVGERQFHGGGAGLVHPESLIRGTRGRENGVPSGSGRQKNHCVRRAGNGQKKFFGYLSRGSDTGVSASMARDDYIVVIQEISPARSRGTDSSGSRGGAGATNEGKQKAFVPPPAGRAGRVPREVFRGKCRIPPAGFASRGRVVSPRRGTRRPPLGASGALPPRFARLRGRGLPRFCRLHHVGPLRPGTKNLPPPDPRVGNTNISNEIIPARLT